MRVGGAAILVAAVLSFALGSSAHADYLDVAGWKKLISPFANANASIPVLGSAEIDHRTGARANVTLRCAESGRITVTIGIANANFDLGHNNSIVVQEKLDNYNPYNRSGILQNSSRYTYESYASHNFVKAQYLLIQIPINGEDQILRLPFMDPVVANLVSQCVLVEEASNQEHERQQEREKLCEGEQLKFDQCYHSCAVPVGRSEIAEACTRICEGKWPTPHCN
jgi:hypothetical protein